MSIRIQVPDSGSGILCFHIILSNYMGTVFSNKDVCLIGQRETQCHRSTLMHHETWLDYKRGILRRLPTPHDEKPSKFKRIRCRTLVNPTNTMLIIYLLVLTYESTQCFIGNEVWGVLCAFLLPSPCAGPINITGISFTIIFNA